MVLVVLAAGCKHEEEASGAADDTGNAGNIGLTSAIDSAKAAADHAAASPTAEDKQRAPRDAMGRGSGDRPWLIRGTAMPSPSGLRFFRCGDTTPHLVDDQTGQDLEELITAFRRPDDAVYVEVMGEIAPATGHGVPPGVRGVVVARELLFLSMEQGHGGCDRSFPGIEFVARGEEPFWTVTVSREGATLTSPDRPAGVVFDQLAVRQNATEWVYTARRSGVDEATGGKGADDRVSGEGVPDKETPIDIALTLTREPCRGTMAGDWFAWRAQLLLDGVIHTGCARPGHPAPRHGE
jgi:uncharacterized membrane protein